MNRDRRFRKHGLLDDDQKKLLRVLAIPLIVIILIIIILIADRTSRNDQDSASEPETEITTPAETPTGPNGAESSDPDASETEPTETSATEPADPYESDTLKRNTDPAIEALINNYFIARKDADAELMNSLYGIEMDQWQLETERVRLWTNAKYMTDFSNIRIYVMDGPDENSRLVYATTNISFRFVETQAPMIMCSYITTGADGNYLLVNNRDHTFEQNQHLEQANQREDVRRLAADINRGLTEALAEDEELRSVYGILHSNSPVWGDEYQESVADVQILTDEELEARAANENTDGTDAAASTEAADATTEAAPEASAETPAEAEAPEPATTAAAE